ncbi:MAG: hypothetical protein ACXWV9_02455 [Flavisolibacter sp.]
MKKFLFLFVALSTVISSFAVGNLVVPPVEKKPKLLASEVFIPIGKSGKKISLLELSEINVKELESLTGDKMKFTDKVGFKIAQSKLRSSINADGTFDNRKLDKMAAKAADGSSFHLGGFALGFLLTIIGVLIAYLINDDKKAQRVKWAWIGFAAGLVLWLIFGVLI